MSHLPDLNLLPGSPTTLDQVSTEGVLIDLNKPCQEDQHPLNLTSGSRQDKKHSLLDLNNEPCEENESSQHNTMSLEVEDDMHFEYDEMHMQHGFYEEPNLHLREGFSEESNLKIGKRFSSNNLLYFNYFGTCV